VITAPLTTNGFEAPTRIKSKFNQHKGLIILDQIRTIDKRRIIKKLGVVSYAEQKQIAKTLIEIFAY